MVATARMKFAPLYPILSRSDGTSVPFIDISREISQSYFAFEVNIQIKYPLTQV